MENGAGHGFSFLGVLYPPEAGLIGIGNVASGPRSFLAGLTILSPVADRFGPWGQPEAANVLLNSE